MSKSHFGNYYLTNIYIYIYFFFFQLLHNLQVRTLNTWWNSYRDRKKGRPPNYRNKSTKPRKKNLTTKHTFKK